MRGKLCVCRSQKRGIFYCEGVQCVLQAKEPDTVDGGRVYQPTVSVAWVTKERESNYQRTGASRLALRSGVRDSRVVETERFEDPSTSSFLRW